MQNNIEYNAVAEQEEHPFLAIAFWLAVIGMFTVPVFTVVVLAISLGIYVSYQIIKAVVKGLKEII